MQKSIKILLDKHMMLLFLVFCAFLAVFFSCGVTFKFFHFVDVNENQILYTMSALAQILGTVYGLTLTAYTFYSNRLKCNNEDDYREAIDSLLVKHFYNFKIISVCVFLILMCCVYSMLTINSFDRLHIFLLNFSICMFAAVFITILFFGIFLLNPQNIIQELEKLHTEVDKKYDINENEREAVSTGEFLMKYITLEGLLKEKAEKVEPSLGKYGMFSVFDAIKVLQKNGKIASNTLANIHDLRVYRNGLVHGHIPEHDKIPSNIYVLLKDTISKIDG